MSDSGFYYGPQTISTLDWLDAMSIEHNKRQQYEAQEGLEHFGEYLSENAPIEERKDSLSCTSPLSDMRVAHEQLPSISEVSSGTGVQYLQPNKLFYDHIGIARKCVINGVDALRTIPPFRYLDEGYGYETQPEVQYIPPTQTYNTPGPSTPPVNNMNMPLQDLSFALPQDYPLDFTPSSEVSTPGLEYGRGSPSSDGVCYTPFNSPSSTETGTQIDWYEQSSLGTVIPPTYPMPTSIPSLIPTNGTDFYVQNFYLDPILQLPINTLPLATQSREPKSAVRSYPAHRTSRKRIRHQEYEHDLSLRQEKYTKEKPIIEHGYKCPSHYPPIDVDTSKAIWCKDERDIVHDCAKPYVCLWKTCTKKFSTQKDRDRHLGSYHNNEGEEKKYEGKGKKKETENKRARQRSVFRCPFCHKGSSRSDALKRHVNALHKRELPLPPDTYRDGLPEWLTSKDVVEPKLWDPIRETFDIYWRTGTLRH